MRKSDVGPNLKQHVTLCSIEPLLRPTSLIFQSEKTVTAIQFLLVFTTECGTEDAFTFSSSCLELIF